MGETLRQVLEGLVKKFSEDLSREDLEDYAQVIVDFSRESLPIIKAIDLSLTGKTECTAQLSLDEFSRELEKNCGAYVVYLSDCGYSRLIIDPWAEGSLLVGLDRGLSRVPVIQKWDEMVK